MISCDFGDTPHMPYVKHIYYEEAGAGPALILLHCPALSHVYWRPIMDRLQSTFRCIAPDIRGHGRSGKGDTPWTFQDIASDVHLLCTHLGLNRPALVGYSSGATIALQAVIDHPQAFGAVVAVSAFSECCTLNMRVKVALGLIATNLGLTRLIGPNVIGSNSTGTDHTQAMLPDAKQVRPTSLRSFLLQSRRVNITDQLDKIKIPVLLAYGATDEWMHGYYRILQRGIPHARAAFFPNTDHRVPTRKPADMAAAITQFLRH